MNFLYRSIFFLYVLSIYSCEKAENRVCLKSAGRIVSKVITLDNFIKMDLYEHIKFELVQDSVNKIIFTGGENLLSNIYVNQTDEKLIVSNNNKCAFLRSYNKLVKAEIHFKDLNELNYYGTEEITNKEVLTLPWFVLRILSGSGTVNLNLDSKILYASSSGGYGDFKLAGKTDYISIYINNNGFCDTYGLTVKDSLDVTSKSMGIIKLNADKTLLKAEVKNGGDIYYIGTPTDIIFKKNGNGNLIKN